MPNSVALLAIGIGGNVDDQHHSTGAIAGLTGNYRDIRYHVEMLTRYIRADRPRTNHHPTYALQKRLDLKLGDTMALEMARGPRDYRVIGFFTRGDCQVL